jgi:hypothetical protein
VIASAASPAQTAATIALGRHRPSMLTNLGTRLGARKSSCVLAIDATMASTPSTDDSVHHSLLRLLDVSSSSLLLHELSSSSLSRAALVIEFCALKSLTNVQHGRTLQGQKGRLFAPGLGTWPIAHGTAVPRERGGLAWWRMSIRA